ncbi:MAG TPA: ABC transporter permease [Bryobacteraceae bacterium]|jgi:predicted permease|nr:ABC transporter permease [Bryobacteraceae bacterium]
MPDWKNLVRQRIGALGLTGAQQAELTEEMAQHLEDRYNDLLKSGASAEEAQRNALAELDDFKPNRPPRQEPAPLGAGSSGRRLEQIRKDLQYAFRSLRKNPGFALVVILTLGLGIGANTTVFTLVNTLLLNPLPVPGTSALAAVNMTQAGSKRLLPVSYADLKDLQARNTTFASLAGYTSPRIVTFQPHGESERMFAELVTGNYFAALGLKPALGRFFSSSEDTPPGAHPVAVMNYATWQGRFGGARDIVGRALRLNNLEFTVIGVAPPGFIGVNAIFGPNLWIPASMAEQLLPNEMQNALAERSKKLFQGVGRLKPGITRAQAQANVAALGAGLRREYPEADEGYDVAARPIEDVLLGSSGAGPGSIQFAGAGLLIIVGIVLLIACSNIANLLLARSSARQHELAIRLASGASRGRLVQQLLTESVLLGFLGGVVGMILGYGGLRIIWSFLPAEVSANLIAPKLSVLVFLFTAVLSLATGFLFGTGPALRATRMNLADVLKEDSQRAGRSSKKITIANALLVGQVALSFLLLIVGALFLRSMQHAYQIDPGFQTRHLAVFLTNPGGAGYSVPEVKTFYREARERVSGMPGIASAAWSSNLPLWGRIASGFKVEGHEARSKAETITAVLTTIDGDYFGAAGIPIVQGRAFTTADRSDSAPVAIVNEKMARDYWPGGQVLGKRIELPGEKTMRQIVGVARNADYSSLGEPPQDCVYVPLEQNFIDSMTLYVRSKADPQQILIPVQRELRAVAPRVSAKDIRTGGRIISDALFYARVGVGLLSIFGLLALGLASIGLYGILAYSVNQRKREIGIRMALGAARASVLRLVLRQGMSLVLTGVVGGFLAALVVARLLARMLYGVTATDPESIAMAAGILLLVALIACYLPARWASRVDPLTALRES